MQPAIDDAYLVRRAREGYLDAYHVLVERHGPRAYRVALRLLGNREDAEDVTQDALLAAWQALPTFRAESSFATWLYRIVTTRALNKSTRTVRTETINATPEPADPARGPAEQAEQDLIAAAVTEAIDALPTAQRLALILHQFEGLSYSEIAEITGSTVAAVRSHLHRARRTLATTLQDWR
ncbi:RNA polymerase sigma factor [Dactylosporangium roseum]|uniref:RNA polymerase sigma factor n=1 Tax=Dactylosporangium roseum TaxID=47989 RepID=A0ABY5ZFX8_9ACTN|nr:RNA polymerase sigma factor [Dactylosporangium roseum]UWZ39603.1 RNA polymerase sigma factor [Dactylosporangium roseum]